MKVFSKEKFYADADLTSESRERAREVGWPEDCDGKTKEECIALGYWVNSDWMEER